MYKNIICFFSFPFLTRNVKKKVGDGRDTHTGVRYESSGLLRSAFMGLVQGHLKALNHLNFSSLLYFRESGTDQAFLSLSTQDSLTQGQRTERRNV